MVHVESMEVNNAGGCCFAAQVHFTSCINDELSPILSIKTFGLVRYAMLNWDGVVQLIFIEIPNRHCCQAWNKRNDRITRKALGRSRRKISQPKRAVVIKRRKSQSIVLRYYWIQNACVRQGFRAKTTSLPL